MGTMICTQCGYANVETHQLCVICATPVPARASAQPVPVRPYFANDPDGPAYHEIPATPPPLPFAPPPVPAWTPPPVYAPPAAQSNPQQFHTLSAYSAQAVLASRGERFLAWLVDTAGLGAAVVFSEFLNEFAGPDLVSHGWTMAFIYLSYFSMQLYLLSAQGQTLGKRAMGLRIVKADTLDNGGFVTNVLIRALVPLFLGAISCHLFTLVDILCIFGDERKCVHDNIAGTIVVKAQSQP